MDFLRQTLGQAPANNQIPFPSNHPKLPEFTNIMRGSSTIREMTDDMKVLVNLPQTPDVKIYEENWKDYTDILLRYKPETLIKNLESFSPTKTGDKAVDTAFRSLETQVHTELHKYADCMEAYNKAWWDMLIRALTKASTKTTRFQASDASLLLSELAGISKSYRKRDFKKGMKEAYPDNKEFEMAITMGADYIKRQMKDLARLESQIKAHHDWVGDKHPDLYRMERIRQLGFLNAHKSNTQIKDEQRNQRIRSRTRKIRIIGWLIILIILLGFGVTSMVLGLVLFPLPPPHILSFKLLQLL